MASERETEFGYFAFKKEAKLSASEVPGEVVGSGEEDLRCRSLLTVCQRRLGLSEAEDTRLVHPFIPFDRTPRTCDRQTQTDGHRAIASTRASIASCR